MIKKTLKLLAIFTLLISCSKDDSAQEITNQEKSGNEVIEEMVEIPTPVIESISSDFILHGETITISGTNFINPEFETELLIDDVSFEYNSLTDNLIEIIIDQSVGIENKTIEININNTKSNALNVFFVPKGWYMVSEEIYVNRCYIFDNTNTLVLLHNSRNMENSFFGKILRLETSADGYSSISLPQISNFTFLEMFNDQIGVASNTIEGFFSNDGFTTGLEFVNFFENSANASPFNTKPTFINETSAIVTNSLGSYAFTNDQGTSLTFSNSRDNGISTIFGEGEFSYRRRSGFIGDDGTTYEIGWNPLIDNTQTIIKSSNGIDNWEVVNEDIEFAFDVEFVDTDLLLAIQTDGLMKSTDFGNTWEPINIDFGDQDYTSDEIYIRDKANWYFLTENTLYNTTDSGETWNLELELPENAEIEHISFSDSKIILGGTNILMVKHE